MNIKQLIKELKSIKKRYGNCEVQILLKDLSLKNIESFYINPPQQIVGLIQERQQEENKKEDA